MADWQQVKATLAESDRVSSALRGINEFHMEFIDCHGTGALKALADELEAIIARIEGHGSTVTGPSDPRSESWAI